MNERNIIEQFKHTVINNASVELRRLLQEHPFVTNQINEPWFPFDTPAIVAAAAKGNREAVDILLEFGADLHAKSSWWAGGFGVLHHDHLELSRYLIERGAPVDIHAASLLGMLDTVKEIIAKDPLAVNQRGPDGQVPLHFATQHEIMDVLLAHGADIHIRDIDHGSTPIQWAIDNTDKCKYLVAHGAAVDIFMAIQIGDIELIQSLLRDDPESLQAQVGRGIFTSGDSNGGHIYEYKIGIHARPLHVAARRNHPDVVDLISRHSPPNQRLLLACLQGNQAAVQEQLAKDANLVKSLSTEELSSIADAAWKNEDQAVRTMLEAGFPADSRRSNKDCTALHNAAIRGNKEVVQLLLEHGASVQLTQGYGGNALGSCLWGSVHMRDSTGDYPSVLEQLIDAGSPLPNLLAGSEEVKEVLRRHGVHTTN
ncbi:ankyrin repeat domain-containing protein [Paenibacillus qinlingensis]|uniref:Ankyrin repeat protein n=1 Tax=Paenibacillus qinlingensis TaxID=1837343 RepID=A0ABU1NRL6_9BACL|nr:ankyrin repeat domain-containing protein [Paenibacillus qinlingensis]MDR6550122.1 ankyrin repeat protein [Paenibacillus qinlingensis]